MPLDVLQPVSQPSVATLQVLLHPVCSREAQEYVELQVFVHDQARLLRFSSAGGQQFVQSLDEVRLRVWVDVGDAHDFDHDVHVENYGVHDFVACGYVHVCHGTGLPERHCTFGKGLRFCCTPRGARSNLACLLEDCRRLCMPGAQL